MSKLKVIDLLNKITNGEEALNKISVKGKIFEYNNSYESIEQLYIDNGLNWFDEIDINLNTEIEIMEEPKKIEFACSIEVIGQCDNYLIDNRINEYVIDIINRNIEKLYDKQCEIIDYINKDKE